MAEITQNILSTLKVAAHVRAEDESSDCDDYVFYSGAQWMVGILQGIMLDDDKLTEIRDGLDETTAQTIRGFIDSRI